MVIGSVNTPVMPLTGCTWVRALELVVVGAPVLAELPSVEAVIERHDDYLVVKKTGEAREQLAREHPRARHQT